MHGHCALTAEGNESANEVRSQSLKPPVGSASGMPLVAYFQVPKTATGSLAGPFDCWSPARQFAS